MGFFSWNCKGCGKSIKAPYDMPKGMEWQNSAVLVDEDGVAIRGQYDGYGRFENTEDCLEDLSANGDPALWHRKCFDAATPEQQADTTPSEYASDQGFFYDDEDSGKHSILG